MRQVFLSAGIFSLTFFWMSSASAKIEQWNFQDPTDYQFDSQKIESGDGNTRLVKRLPYRDEKAEGFDRGTHVENTWAASGFEELTSATLDEHHGVKLPLPIGNNISGLMSLWHFDEPSGTNILDEVGRNIAKASDAEIVTGQTGFNYARRFEGTKSYVFIPHYQSVQFDGNFTIETWIRPNRTVQTKPQTIISRWQTVAAQKSFALQISPEGKMDFLVSADGATTVHHLGDTVLSPSLWYHVAAVCTGSDLRIYLNGVLDSEPTPFHGPVYQASNPIYLGALVNNRLDEFFDGVMDEVAFYRRAVSEAEFMTHFGNPEALVGLWHLNERAGVLADRSGYGHNATTHENPVYESEGKLGTSLHFNGKNQFLEIPATFRFATEDSLTLEAWVKPDKLPEFQKSGSIIASTGGQTTYALSLIGPDGRLEFSAPSLAPAEIVSRNTLMPNVWQHVAVTLGYGTIRLYINGILDSSANYHGFLKTGKAGLRIGTDASGTRPFSGSIDEASVFRRAKTDTEIAASAGLHPSAGIYRSSIKDAGNLSAWQTLSWGEALPYKKEVAADQKGLLHLYHFNEADAANLADGHSDGIVMNAVGTYSVPGIFAGARWFAEIGRDKIISEREFPSLSTFTISFWFQFASSEPGAADRLFSIGDENPTVYRAAPDGKLHVAAAGARKIISANTLKDTVWHYLALTSDGSHLFLYIDGVLSGTTPFINATAPDPLVLGNLKSSDTFQGAIDEFALFNYPLTREDIANHYLAGKLDLKFLVRASKGDSFEDALWRGPLGNNWIERETSPYSVALWHFNEKEFRGKSGELVDASRFANHGVAYGNILASPNGAVWGGAYFNGAGDYMEVADSESLHAANFTLSAWIEPSEISEAGSRILDKRYAAGAPVFSSFSLELAARNRLALRIGRPGGYHIITTERDGEIAAGRWNHVAATYDGKEIKLYINGVLKKSAAFSETIPYDSGPLYIGRYGSGDSGYFHGTIDETGIENRALDQDEIKSFFLKADPENFYRQSALEKLAITGERYFQYQAFLSSDFPLASPQLKWVELQGNTYPTDSPSISNNASVSFADISTFRERPGKNNQGNISYQLSNDGSNWFYHNGRHWVIASGAEESNTGSQVASRIKDFPKEIGIGSFYFKAFLHSPTGIEPVELEAVELDYLPNKLTMTSPNGGEAWLVGSEQQITWNSTGEVQKVQLEYSKDNFEKDFHVIAKEIPNTGSYAWKIPDDLSPTVKIRISDALDPRIHDTSDISFRVVGAFEIVAPNWNERWEVDSEQTITWRTLGNIPQVKLEYSTDEFKQAIFPMVDALKNEGKFSWKVPDSISSTVKVRVSDIRDPLVFDQSNDTFAVIGKISVLSPEANARLIVGSEAEVRWQSTGTIAAVKIEYTTGPDKPEMTWTTVEASTLNRNSYLWKVPDQIDSNIRLRISDANDKKVFAESQSFAIVGGLRLLTPKEGEYWTVGSRRKIAWQTVGTIPAVTLEYAPLDSIPQHAIEKNPEAFFRSLPWKTFGQAVPNIGSYVWEIPDALSERMIIRVRDTRDPFVSAFNAEPFHVIPGFTLKIPNGGEGFRIGSEANIQWETKGSIPKVKLEYSKDGFTSDIHEIITEASNIGRFAWKVPDDPSLAIQIRISDPSVSQASDISDAPLRIYGAFKILEPKNGEKYEVGSLATLEWKTLGNIPKVRLEFSGDDFNKDIRVIAESMANSGKYQWTVPDNIGAGYRLRISDVRDPQAFRISKAKFSIVGNFHLVTPAGGENFTVGTVIPITWKGAGSIPLVRLDYSEDNFTKSFNTLSDAAPNNGTFDWTVPNRIGQHFKIRIWDPAHPDTMYVMETPSRIIGGFTLAAPNGGEVLFVGEPFQISWQTFGTMPRVKLEFSSDNFNRDINEIADSYENIGLYKWNVPDALSGQYKVRISDPKDSTAYDISNSDFRIRSRFILKKPAGGEGWAVGQKQIIEWQTSGNVPEVLLEYSTDDFKSSTTIATAVPNTGTFEWLIPNQVSQNVKVRASDVKDPGAFDISKSPFHIQGVLALTSPNGGEIWKVGQSNPIIWTTLGEIKGVRLEYSRDSFASESKVIAESLVNSGSYNWTIPDDISTQTKVRIVDLNDPAVQVVSAKPFQIAAAFMMMSPNGSEIWHAAEKREISWVTIGTVPEVNLTFCAPGKTVSAPLVIPAKAGIHVNQNGSLPEIFNRGSKLDPPVKPGDDKVKAFGDDKQDCFKNPELIERGVPNDGRYVWDIPRITGENFKLQVCDSQNPSVCDNSDGVFSLHSPFEMIYPRGGESWPVGSDQEIRWSTYGNVNHVLIQYAALDSNQKQTPVIWKKMIEELKNEGHYLFKVPDDISKNVIFRVSDWEDESLYAETKEPVKFTAVLTLLTPNGGEKWAAGRTEKIAWDIIGTTPNVRLEYSNDNFQKDVRPIETSYANTGTYEWTVPADLGVTMKVRVLDAKDQAVFDVSDNPFKIMPGFTLESPNGGEIWIVGSKQKIKWKTAGKSNAVRLEFSLSSPGLTGGSNLKMDSRFSAIKTARLVRTDFAAIFGERGNDISWNLIADNAPNGGEFEWVIPSQVGKEMLLRVSDSRDPDAFDVSNAGFEVRPDIVVASPNGGENFIIATPSQIRWTTIGPVGDVKIEYSKDDFKSDVHVIAAEAPDKGFFFWTPSDDVTASAKIRVTSLLDARVMDVTDQPFKILPAIHILNPLGGEKWTVGQNHILKWDWRGSLDQVKIEYSLDNFSSADVIADKLSNTGSYTWTIPNTVSANARLRISDAVHPEAFAASENPFKIIPGFEIASPKGGELWTIGERHSIQWKTSGTSDRVRLEYGVSTENAYAWKTIAQVLQNTGKYDWTVPSDVSSKAKVRVLDATDSDAFGESAAPFKILAHFEIANPKSGETLFVGDKYQIRWNTVGHVPSVKLEFLQSNAEGGTNPVPRVIENLWANSGSYYWTVPDATSEEVWLKISDTAEPDSYYQSELPFRIRGKLQLVLPEGKKSWPIGSIQTLKWNTTGTISYVSLEYSTDDKIWKPIAKAVPNAGSYGWTIPDDSALAVKLRIADAGNPEVFGESAEPVIIAAQFTFKNPSEGKIWVVGTPETIEWQTMGHVKKVWLEYATDGHWRPVAGPIPDTGAYAWTAPDSISSRVQLRIKDGDNAEAFAISPELKITGVLKLDAPVGGEVMHVGSKEMIHWVTIGTIPNVRIEGIVDDDKNETFVIADSVRNQGGFDWVIPDKITNNIKIRIADVRDDSVANISPRPFSIVGDFNVVSPKGGEDWIVGSEHEIAWTSQGTMASVLLEYSRDDFYRDVNLIASDVPNTGAAVWTIPDSISKSLKIRISDLRDSRAVAISNEPFKIKGAIAIDTPAEGDIWSVASKQSIKWTAQGTIPRVRIEYSRDDFQKDIQVVENSLKNIGSYDWQIPDIISNTLKIRIANAEDASVFGIAGPLKVYGSLKLKSPAGGEILKVLGRHSIAWETVGNISKIRLEYSRDDFNQDIHEIIHDAKNTGAYEWTIPDDIGGAVKIRVADASNLSVFDMSPAPFEIRGSLTLLTETEGRRWNVASHQEIVWNAIGTIPFVRLEYSKDDFFKDHQFIADNLENKGKLMWEVPDDISDRIRIRVSDARNAEVFAESHAPASIVGGLTLTQPKKESAFAVGSEQTIGWETIGSIPAVRLEYSTSEISLPEIKGPAAKQEAEAIKKALPFVAEQAPGAWKLITGSVENSGTFQWRIPDDISDLVRIRVSDVHDPLVQHTSDAFSITGRFEFLTPQGGEQWIVGTKHDLVWKSTGTIPEVTLQYSRDHFSKDIQAIAEKILNTGRLIWDVPDAISDKIEIRIQDARDPGVGAVTPHSISVVGNFVLFDPKDSGPWKVDSEQRIEWQTIGTISAVRLEYELVSSENTENRSPESQSPQYHVIQDQIPNQGSFVWHVPNQSVEGIRLRISDAANPTVFSETKSVIKLQGVLKFLAPNALERWSVGSTQKLAWETRGLMPEVRLEASRDEFKKDIRILYPLIPNTGSATWIVDDMITKNLRIRVVDPANPSVYAETPAPIEIVGGFLIQIPNGGENWEVGSKQEIEWQTVGTILRVKLEYDGDPQMRQPFVIAENLPNIGKYTWTVPDSIASDLWLRISDASDPEVSSLSQSPFGIHGAIQLQKPLGGEILKVGDQAEIVWQTKGTIPKVRLEFSKDDFTTATPIQGLIPNDGHFTWHVPDIVSERIRIRVVDAADDAVSSASRMPSKVEGSLAFISPPGNEFLRVGSQKMLNWQTLGTIPYVNLEYSADNFATSFPIMLGLANKGSYAWTVPDAPADHLQVRISNAEDRSVFAVTQNVFQIGGAMELLAPSGGEIWKVGDEQEIRWNTTGTIPKVRIEISSDQFHDQIKAIEPALENSGTYKWKVPDLISDGLQIRVSDLNNPQISDRSKAAFKIAGDLEILSPKGGEVWQVGTRKHLTWRTTGTLPQIQLEYSTDNFMNAMLIASKVANTGSYDWEIPDLAGSSIQIRISDANDPSVNFTTAYTVEVQGTLAITSPKGGEVWTAGGQQLIAWRTTGTIPNVNLEYTPDDSMETQTMASGIANTGSFLWAIPGISARHLKIKVTDSLNTNIFSELAVGVEIQGKLVITSPQGGEVWLVGTQHPITWSSVGSIKKVRLEYSTDEFRTIVPIAMNAPNGGRFIWEIPDAVSREVKIRVTDADNSSVSSETTQPFEIRGALSLTNPTGGEIWGVGTRHAISWQNMGTIPQVRLEYSTDNFATDVQIIAAAVANKGSYYWDVPSIKGAEAKIRITDVSNPYVFDVSREPFRVVGDLKMIFPDGGEIFRVGERLEILWRSTPNITNIKLEYSADNFETSQVVTPAAANTGKFVWSVPDKITDNMKLRISDAQNAAVFAIPKAPFCVSGALEMKSAETNVVWTMGASQMIRWTTSGTIPEVRLEYSGDQFATSLPIAMKATNAGSFNWNVPEITTKEIRLRVSDPADPAVQSTSKGSIHVVGKLRLLTPSGGERWVTNEERVIRWQTVGYIAQVGLEYSKDNFDRDIHLIAAAIPNVGSYFWTVPNDRSSQMRVRIFNPEDRAISAVSEEPFQVDYYRIKWVVRDLKTHEHLSGLLYASSAGKAEPGLSSPVNLEYPYGIYTSVWSKPGYGEFRNTWLADKDQNFTVDLEPGAAAVDQPRVDFDYDAEKDLMRITSWVERDGKMVPTVMQSEVRIYQDAKLINTLTSSNPDSKGMFRMVWDTTGIAGDTRYLASASITDAAGKVLTSPISYQLNIPVKEKKEPVVRRRILSSFLKPAGAMHPKQQEKQQEMPAPTEKTSASEEQSSMPSPEASNADENTNRVPKIVAPAVIQAELIVPESAAVNETISITYMGAPGMLPVVDVYDTNHKLIVRSQPMEEKDSFGKFSYLLPIRGIAFIPGKSITVSVIDRKSSRFKSASIQIKSVAREAGLEKVEGSNSILQLLIRFDRQIEALKRAANHEGDITVVLASIEKILSELNGTLSEETLDQMVREKLNRVADELAKVVHQKGYDMDFLIAKPLLPTSGMEEVNNKIHQVRSAISMLERLYYYSVTRAH